MHYIAIKITQITFFYVIIRHHTRHKQYTQLRYAATHLAINAFNFNVIYQPIIFYYMIF